MTLTERLARPILQTETQVADLRKSMEELRQQCKHRVASLVVEVLYRVRSPFTSHANLHTYIFMIQMFLFFNYENSLCVVFEYVLYRLRVTSRR